MAETIFDTIGREMRYLEYKIRQHQAKRKRKKEKQNALASLGPSSENHHNRHHKSESREHERTTLEITPHAHGFQHRKRSSGRRKERSPSNTAPVSDPWGAPFEKSKETSSVIDHFDPWSSTNAPTQNRGQGLTFNEPVREIAATTYQFNGQQNPTRLLPPPPKATLSNSSPTQFNNSWTQANPNAPTTATTIFSSFPPISPNTSSFNPFSLTGNIAPSEKFDKGVDQTAAYSQPAGSVPVFADILTPDNLLNNINQTSTESRNTQQGNKTGEAFLDNNSDLVNFDGLVSKNRGNSRELFYPKSTRVCLNEMKTDKQQQPPPSTPSNVAPNFTQFMTSPMTQLTQVFPGSNASRPLGASSNPFANAQLSLSQTRRVSNEVDDLLF